MAQGQPYLTICSLYIVSLKILYVFGCIPVFKRGTAAHFNVLHYKWQLRSVLWPGKKWRRGQGPAYLSMAVQSFVGPWPLFQFLNLHTVGWTPRLGDQPVTRPLPTHRINEQRHPILSGIWTHDISVQASEDSSCLTTARPLWTAITYPSFALYYVTVMTIPEHKPLYTCLLSKQQKCEGKVKLSL
jgi:hypothetical protein